MLDESLEAYWQAVRPKRVGTVHRPSLAATSVNPFRTNIEIHGRITDPYEVVRQQIERMMTQAFRQDDFQVEVERQLHSALGRAYPDALIEVVVQPDGFPQTINTTIRITPPGTAHAFQATTRIEPRP